MISGPFRCAAAFLILSAAACKPPASDDYIDRAARSEAAEGPSAPIASPDTEGAIWADGQVADRLLYGLPGEHPFVALTCAGEGTDRIVQITRYTISDPEAKALVALIGNGHLARLPVESEWNGKVWLWEGRYAPGNPDLDVLSGPRAIEMTIPGAGSVILNPSDRPADLLDRCRRLVSGIPAPE